MESSERRTYSANERVYTAPAPACTAPPYRIMGVPLTSECGHLASAEFVT
jgi:hypothetical protein